MLKSRDAPLFSGARRGSPVGAALSLLPAVLAGLGPRVNKLAPPLPRWLRWTGQPRAASRVTALVLRRPLAVLASGVAVLGALAVFTLQLHTGYDYGLSALKNQPAGRADAAIAAAFGPGAISPTQVVFITGGQPLSGRDLQVIAALDARLARDPEVAAVTSLPAMLGGPSAAARALTAARTSPALAAQLSPVVNAAHGATLTVMTITPRTAFDTTQAAQLATSLRAELPAVLPGTGMHAFVGGATAAVTDITHEINAKTPLVLALIVIVALLLLGAAFGSPMVAVVGLAGTMLSVGAAYGLLHCVFQAGHAGDIFGYHSTGFVESFLPLMLFAILVGLSTDYQVFLISRIKEEWQRSGDPAAAIAAGLQRSGRVILSAAAIMIIVFASFVSTTYVVTKEIGFALAAVILIDAAITRWLLVPAALRLLGSRAWTWPPAPRFRRSTPPLARQPSARPCQARAVTGTAETARAGRMILPPPGTAYCAALPVGSAATARDLTLDGFETAPASGWPRRPSDRGDENVCEEGSSGGGGVSADSACSARHTPHPASTRSPATWACSAAPSVAR